MQDPREIQDLMQRGLKELQSMKVGTHCGALYTCKLVHIWRSWAEDTSKLSWTIRFQQVSTCNETKLTSRTIETDRCQPVLPIRSIGGRRGEDGTLYLHARYLAPPAPPRSFLRVTR